MMKDTPLVSNKKKYIALIPCEYWRYCARSRGQDILGGGEKDLFKKVEIKEN